MLMDPPDQRFSPVQEKPVQGFDASSVLGRLVVVMLSWLVCRI